MPTRGELRQEAIRRGLIEPPPVTNPANEVPDYLAGAAMFQSTMNMGQRVASRLGLAEPPEGMQRLRELYPVASAIGENAPIAATALIPGGTMAQMGIGGVVGALTADNPAEGAVAGVGGAAIGAGVSSLATRAGRATYRGLQGIRRGSDDLIMPSGIRTTPGKLTGNKQLQQVESGLARSPFGSRRFVEIDNHNEKLLRNRVLSFLKQDGAESLDQAIEQSLDDALVKMGKGIPDGASITLDQNQFRNLQVIQGAGEAIDVPDNLMLTGRELKDVLSDLKGALRSSKATVRRRALQALNDVDVQLRGAEGVDAATYREGSGMYKRWLTITDGQAISKADGELVNAPTLLTNLEKKYGRAAVKAGKTTGIDELDILIQTARDKARVGSIVPDSGTPTGMALQTATPVGVVGQFAAGETLGSPAGFGVVTGLTQKTPGASAAGGAVGRAITTGAVRDDEERSGISGRNARNR